MDVLLTDICMYQVSGLEAAAQIREKYPWMKIVLLSGYREFEYAREAIRCQVYEYLLKPIDYEKLRSVFANIKRELDEVSREETLLRSFGEGEYDQLLNLIKVVAGSVMGEGEEAWLAQAHDAERAPGGAGGAGEAAVGTAAGEAVPEGSEAGGGVWAAAEFSASRGHGGFS